jgi:hypothetical protein
MRSRRWGQGSTWTGPARCPDERHEDPREKRNPVPIVVPARDEVPRGEKHSLVDEHSRKGRRDTRRQANGIGTTNDDQRADVLVLVVCVLRLRVRDGLRRWGKCKAGEDQWDEKWQN